MATFSATWTENVNLHTSASLAAVTSTTDDVDIDTGGYDLIAVTIEIAFGATPDNDVTVEFFASTDSGTNDDTEAMLESSIAQATSTTKRRTYVITGVPYVAVKVTNNDSADSVTYDSWYAGRKFTDA